MRKRIDDYSSQIRELASQGFNNRQIALELGLSPGSVLFHIKINNVEVVNGRFLVTDDQHKQQVKSLYEQNKTLTEISEIVGIPYKRVQRYVLASGVKVKSSLEMTRSRSSINRKAFAELDEETAYWLGWIITDGCLSDRNIVSLYLKSTDVALLEQYKQYIKPEGQLNEAVTNRDGKQFKSVGISVMCSQVAENLRKHNVSSRKSLKEQLPNFDTVHHELAPVFWRATIEGDGYIRKTRNAEIQLIGGITLLQGFKDFCEKNSLVKLGKVIRQPRDNKDFHSISYCGQDARNVMKCLWSHGSIFLERKKNIVDSVLSRYEEKEFK
jgi:hypothetical protein